MALELTPSYQNNPSCHSPNKSNVKEFHFVFYLLCAMCYVPFVDRMYSIDYGGHTIHSLSIHFKRTIVAIYLCNICGAGLHSHVRRDTNLWSVFRLIRGRNGASGVFPYSVRRQRSFVLKWLVLCATKRRMGGRGLGRIVPVGHPEKEARRVALVSHQTKLGSATLARGVALSV